MSVRSHRGGFAFVKDHEMILQSLFPKSVVTDHGWPEDGIQCLYPEEQACVEWAGPRRQREFATGRLCARKALARMGIDCFPLLRGKRGQPMWPPGVIGSISHTDDHCAVTVAWRRQIQGLGVDIERIQRLDTSVRDYICTPQEVHWIRTLSTDQRDLGALLIFSAKECIFKCLQPLTGQWLEFKDVTVTFVPTVTKFQANVVAMRPQQPRFRFVGRCHISEKYVYTGMTAYGLRT